MKTSPAVQFLILMLNRKYKSFKNILINRMKEICAENNLNFINVLIDTAYIKQTLKNV